MSDKEVRRLERAAKDDPDAARELDAARRRVEEPELPDDPEDRCRCGCPRRCHVYGGTAWCANPTCPRGGGVNGCPRFEEERRDDDDADLDYAVFHGL